MKAVSAFMTLYVAAFLNVAVEGSVTLPPSDDVKTFEKSLTGKALLPGDWGFSGSHHVFNRRVDNRKPAMVVFAETVEDVVHVVEFVKKWNLTLSIKSTGHCYSGNCVATDSVNLNLSKMNKVSVDASAMTAAVGAASLLQDIYSACEKAGVIAVGGMCPTVGIVG